MQRPGDPRSETQWSVIKAAPESSSSSSNFKIQFQLFQIAYWSIFLLVHCTFMTHLFVVIFCLIFASLNASLKDNIFIVYFFIFLLKLIFVVLAAFVGNNKKNNCHVGLISVCVWEKMLSCFRQKHLSNELGALSHGEPYLKLHCLLGCLKKEEGRK